MISAKTPSDFAPFSSVFQKKKKIAKRGPGPYLQESVPSSLYEEKLQNHVPWSSISALIMAKKKLKKTNGTKETNL